MFFSAQICSDYLLDFFFHEIKKKVIIIKACKRIKFITLYLGGTVMVFQRLLKIEKRPLNIKNVFNNNYLSTLGMGGGVRNILTDPMYNM